MTDTSVIRKRRSRLGDAGHLALRHPLGALGLVIVTALVIIAAFAPMIAPYDPLAFSDDILAPPSAAHLVGTDEYGRDLMSRIIYGSRISLGVGALSVLIGCGTGALAGLIGGYAGGAVDYALQRLIDTLLAFPMLVLALAMVAALGASLFNVVIALAVTIFPNSARIVRSSVLSVREMNYVEAAENLGFSRWRILLRHVLPNSVAPLIILATAGLGNAILAEASLSFLGLGTPPPAPSWGGMLSGNAQAYVVQAPWIAVFPGLAIALVVFGFNFLGDALRDILDPKLD